MRRFFVGVALYTLAAVTPLAAWGGDREIAEQIFLKLKEQQASGVLQGFTLDLGVNEGQVVLKGQVSTESQRDAVLAVANDTEGVSSVIDEISIVPVAKPAPVKIEEDGSVVTTTSPEEFSMDNALAIPPADYAKSPTKDSAVRPVGGSEADQGSGDGEIRASVVRSLTEAQQRGELRGFGVRVSATEGDVLLSGEARSYETKAAVIELVRRTAGVRSVVDDIRVHTATPVARVAPTAAAPAAPSVDPAAPKRSERPVGDQTKQVGHLLPVEVQPVRSQSIGRYAGPVAQAQPVRFDGQVDANVVGGAVAGDLYGAAGAAPLAAAPMAPVPMAPVPMAYGAPHYDSPYLPNYAWPGYAAYPNYAAVTYPQQYSPTAWPYIGPFYPYPQVPLGWRKVSLEWDDGWWFLDFTDR